MGARVKVLVGLLMVLVVMSVGGCYELCYNIYLDEQDPSVAHLFLEALPDDVVTLEDEAIVSWQLEHFWPEICANYEYGKLSYRRGYYWSSRESIPLSKIPGVTWQATEAGRWEFTFELPPLAIDDEEGPFFSNSLVNIEVVFPYGWTVEHANTPYISYYNTEGRYGAKWFIKCRDLCKERSLKLYASVQPAEN